MTARLVLAAHGSTDPRFAPVVEGVAALIRARRRGLDVRVGYLDHGPPHLADAVEEGCVVVPLLLARGFHARVDVPAQAPGVAVTTPVGPDARLAEALTDRLAEAGYDGAGPVVLAAAGSTDPAAIADVRTAAGQLAARLGVEVRPAFVSAGKPLLADVRPQVVSTYLLADGVFAEAVARCGARVVSNPIGAHPALAAVALDRYDAAAAPHKG